MKPYVDKDACVGCGVCPGIAPDVFEMDEDGKAIAIVEEIPEGSYDSAMEAQESCPVSAIKIS